MHISIEKGKTLIIRLLAVGPVVEGKATLRDSWLEAKKQHSVAEQSGEHTEGQLNKQQQDILEEEAATRAPRSVARRDFSASPTKERKRPSFPTEQPSRSLSAGLPVRFKTEVPQLQQLQQTSVPQQLPSFPAAPTAPPQQLYQAYSSPAPQEPEREALLIDL